MRCEHLSDDEVLTTVTSLSGSERGTVVSVISLIGEVEERRLHLRDAYASIHDFCFRALKLSEGEASRRVHVARMSRRCPQVLAALASGAVNLTNLDLMRDVMTADNADELLEGATGKTRFEVEVLVACLAPKPDVPSNISRLPEREASSSNRPWQPPPKPLAPGRFKIQMTGDEELCELIARAQQLTRHENPSGDLAAIFKAALKELVPTLEKEKLGKGVRPRESKPPEDPGDVSAAARREVIARDGEQCAYVSPAGERCRARAWLQVDHCNARALGGEGMVENLRVLCAPHNRYEAEKTFGRAHIEEKIAERRAEAVVRVIERSKDRAPEVAAVAREPMTERSQDRATEVAAVVVRESMTERSQDRAPETSTNSVRSTLKSALVRLGFRAKEVDRAIATFPDEDWTRPLEELLREGLAKLTS